MDDYYYANQYTLEKSTYLDLKVLDCGIQKCEPSHPFGPYVRTYYLVHYILSGKGVFKCNNKEYHLSEGQMFFIFPKKVTFYQADESNPWHYCWFSFTGMKLQEYCQMAGLSIQNPVVSSFSFDKEFILSLLESRNNPIKLTGMSHLFFEKIIQASERNKVKKPIPNQKEYYAERAINYIDLNYWREIKVQELADYCMLDRSYFSRLFKESTGLSPQNFIISYKMSRAKELLLLNELSVGDVSRSVGYNDPLSFSKIFKKTFGVSPAHVN